MTKSVLSLADAKERARAPSAAVTSAVRTVRIEQAALADLQACFRDPQFNDAFTAAAALIAQSSGRTILTGMGKSGLVAQRIAATMTSTGTPSAYLHAAEAGHGDLGMITRADVVLAFSWSGETKELSDILAYCRRFGVPLIGVTSRPTSTLGVYASICIPLPAVSEACPNRLAPTSSTIVQAAFGDALAVALIEVRGFSPSDFHRFHPRGHLGAQLMTIRQIMSAGDAIPKVGSEATVQEAMIEMSIKRLGVTAIVDAAGRLVGAFTDGDLRRSLEHGIDGAISDFMTAKPIVVEPETLAAEVLAIMNRHNISQVFICEGMNLLGVAHIHDILRNGVV